LDGFTEGGSEHLGSPDAWFEVGIVQASKEALLVLFFSPINTLFP
jgi:hypothetical protein